MSESFNLSKPNRKIHAGVILMNSVTEMLDVAPIDLLSSMSLRIHEYPDSTFPPDIKAQALDIEFHWVNESGEPAKLTSGARILPTDTFATCPPLDVVVMGRYNGSYAPTEAELDFIRKSYDDCSAFIAICGGNQAPMQAGLFKNKTVTAPAPFIDVMRETVTDSKWVKRRFQNDGKLWTTGALLNGLDAMRSFGESTWGGEGTLMELLLEVCCWPKRDVNYADA